MKSVVSNVRVYDLEECIKASGYPMQTSPSDLENIEINEKDNKRTSALINASVTDNQAHIQFLTGIRVNFDLTFSNKAWVEAERYRFLEFVSSQSTMHRIAKFDFDSSYNEYVDSRMIDIMKELVDKYNNDQTKENYLRILYSNPCGFTITARMTTNYRCLRNIYKQMD